MKREERFRQCFIINGTKKFYYPRSSEQREKNIAVAKERGYKIVENVKLYPFNTYANQHNFEFVRNRCFCRIYDMQEGVIPYNEEEMDRLESMKETADKLFLLPLPVAWVDGKTLGECRELSTMAINWRIDTCERTGRFEDIKYCY